jgi:histidyl-tRNA synthetase
VAIAGESEIAEGKIMLKNMLSGEQKLVMPDELVLEILK